MTDSTNPYDKRTDDSLAELVTKLATSVRSFNAEDREQLLLAVAERLLARSVPVTVDLGGGFTFHQDPPLGELHDAHGLVSDRLTLDTATKVAEAVTRRAEQQ